jgi:hypothetical protein
MSPFAHVFDCKNLISSPTASGGGAIKLELELEIEIELELGLLTLELELEIELGLLTLELEDEGSEEAPLVLSELEGLLSFPKNN